jgi:hypothetical protein
MYLLIWFQVLYLHTWRRENTLSESLNRQPVITAYWLICTDLTQKLIAGSGSHVRMQAQIWGLKKTGKIMCNVWPSALWSYFVLRLFLAAEAPPLSFLSNMEEALYRQDVQLIVSESVQHLAWRKQIYTPATLHQVLWANPLKHNGNYMYHLL